MRQRERNPWIRFPKYDEEFNGRLALGAPAKSRCQHSYAHSDGARWMLESRLGLFLQDLEHLAAEGERRDREQELVEAERRRRWYAAIAQAREQQIDQQRAKVLAEQLSAWNQAAEIRAFCQAARARTGNAPIPASEAEWLQWAEAYAARLDPLHHALVTPPNPPASREVLRELAKVDACAYPWPFDADGRWVLPQEQPTEPNSWSQPHSARNRLRPCQQDRGEGTFMRRS
ncbi:hypothetical protein [Streptomyces sp. L-9-10]|uniref:hypothetical protein n=1 Tax=Streptomyces sp. L-9-10 TaxID=1478131 RepID=UPI0018781290|nr:hypothetical protein [Streptomyces sp. L-9-10]